MERSYWWYDSDDGQDIWKKVDLAARMAATLSFPVHIYDVLNVSNTTTLSQALVRFGSVSVPMIGCATMFAFTSQILCREVPKLDPKLSYAIGGAVAGSVVGAARKNPWVGAWFAVAFAGLAAATRLGHEEDCPLPWESKFHSVPNDSNWADWDYTRAKAPKDLGPPESYALGHF